MCDIECSARVCTSTNVYMCVRACVVYIEVTFCHTSTGWNVKILTVSGLIKHSFM